MNSQITFFALGAKCGLPSGGVQTPDAPGLSARTIPSRSSIVPRTSPVNPMPKSARKVRRGKECSGLCMILAYDQRSEEFHAKTQRRTQRRKEEIIFIFANLIQTSV